MSLSRREVLVAGLVAAVSPRALADQRQSNTQFTGIETFNRLLAKSDAENWAKLPLDERIGKVGLSLLGVEYVGFTLEHTIDHEVCTVNLLGLDCVTFFESSLAFARMIQVGKRSPEAMLEQVRYTRYRGGKMTDYASRLHYTMDWFHDNVRKGVVRMVTDDLPGSAPFDCRVDWMTTHPSSYKQLKAQSELIPKIAACEAAINARPHRYLPADKIAESERYFQTGDIIGITTDGRGIDISHTGLLVRDEKGVIHFLDASSVSNKVTLEPRLSDAIGRRKKNTGIMVARPIWNDPK